MNEPRPSAPDPSIPPSASTPAAVAGAAAVGGLEFTAAPEAPIQASGQSSVTGSTFKSEMPLTQNVNSAAVVVSVENVELAVRRHIDAVTAKNAWVAPAGLLVTIVAVFVSADFKDVLLSAAVWKALFVLGGLGSLIWLLREVVRAARAPRQDPIKRIVADIMNRPGE